MRILLADDGCGGADARASGSTGLRGMTQRVESVGGALAVVSPAGGGTRLTISAPLTPPWAAGAARAETMRAAGRALIRSGDWQW